MFLTAVTIRIQSLVQRFWQDEKGQDLVEYALIVAAVGLALITTVNQLTQAVVSLYQSMTQGLGSIGVAQ
jgi:Flp pilus assembly pilin Flp